MPSPSRWRCCGRGPAAVRWVPIAINTVQHPLPSPARCYKFGQAVGRAIESYHQDLRVLVLGTGGLSHQLDGTRAGFINKEFDLWCLDKLVGDPAALARRTTLEIVREAGTQGVELLNWIAMRGALTGRVTGSTAIIMSPFPTPPLPCWRWRITSRRNCARQGSAAASAAALPPAAPIANRRR
jgi:hypothetical protein